MTIKLDVDLLFNLLDNLDGDLDFDLVAHQPTAGFERRTGYQRGNAAKGSRPEDTGANGRPRSVDPVGRITSFCAAIASFISGQVSRLYRYSVDALMPSPPSSGSRPILQLHSRISNPAPASNQSHQRSERPERKLEYGCWCASENPQRPEGTVRI